LELDRSRYDFDTKRKLIEVDVRLENNDCVCGISDYNGNDRRTFFNNESKWTFCSIGSWIFPRPNSLTVFTLLSHKGKKGVIFLPSLDSILTHETYQPDHLQIAA